MRDWKGRREIVGVCKCVYAHVRKDCVNVWMCKCESQPAVGDNGSSVWGVAGLDPAEEGQEGGGVLGHPVVGPGCELELPHLPPLTTATLRQEDTQRITLKIIINHDTGHTVVTTIERDGHKVYSTGKMLREEGITGVMDFLFLHQL